MCSGSGRSDFKQEMVVAVGERFSDEVGSPSDTEVTGEGATQPAEGADSSRG